MLASPKYFITYLKLVFLVCLGTGSLTTINGNLAVGPFQGNVSMNWQINSTDNSVNRFVVNPSAATVIFFPASNVVGNIAVGFTNRVRDVGSVSQNNVSFTLLNVTEADAGRYFYKIFPDTDAGGQVLVVAGFPANVSVQNSSLPYENKEYKLQCSAESTSVPLGSGLTMKYQWKRGNGQIITVSDRYSFSSDQSTFIINPLKRDDNGTVLCEAWDHVGAVSHSDLFPLIVILDPGNPWWCTCGWCIGLCVTSGGLLFISVVTAIGIIITEKWKDFENHMSWQILTISIAGVDVIIIAVTGVLAGIVCSCRDCL